MRESCDDLNAPLTFGRQVCQWWQVPTPRSSSQGFIAKLDEHEPGGGFAKCAGPLRKRYPAAHELVWDNFEKLRHRLFAHLGTPVG